MRNIDPTEDSKESSISSNNELNNQTNSINDTTNNNNNKPSKHARPGLSHSRQLKRQDAFVYMSDIKWDQSLYDKPLTTLTPKLNKKVKINDDITKIRILLNQYNIMNPFFEFRETICKRKVFVEAIYNFFGPLLLPIIMWNEGYQGAKNRNYIGCNIASILFNIVIYLFYFGANILHLRANQKTRDLFWYNILLMNHLNIIRCIILGVKYGYHSPTIFEEYRKINPPISSEYIMSLLLMPGWGAQNPLTMAREFWISQKRLRLNISQLKMTFRDTQAFNVDSMKNCQCSKWETSLDWLIPFVYVFTNINNDFISGKLSTFLGLVYLLMLIWSDLSRYGIKILGHNYNNWDECKWDCYILHIIIPIVCGYFLTLTLWWSASMANDFNRRYSRSKILTHLLDPKRKTFDYYMKNTYKSHLFGSKNNKLAKKHLKNLDLHTIDVYDYVSIYSWCQLRSIFYDCGREFLNREEAYVGILLVYVFILTIFLIYGMLEKSITIIFEDMIITMIFNISILGPALWSLSCAKAMNNETLKQKRFFYERTAEMQFYEFKVKDKIEKSNNQQVNENDDGTEKKTENPEDYKNWLNIVTKAREMGECAVDVLDETSYNIKFIGIKADESVQTLIITLSGLLFYLVMYAAIQQKGFLPKWIYTYP